MARTSSIYDHFDLYVTPVTLTSNLPTKRFQMALLLLKDNNCANLFLKSMHKCTSYGPDKFNIWPFDLYLTTVTLTFNLPEKLFQMVLFFLKGNNCAKLFWNPCINVQVMLRPAQYMYLTILNFIWSLWPWPSTHLENVSTGTSPFQGQQLCQIVLKSMHFCTSYGPDKLGRTHGRTHIHGTKIVTTMSRQKWHDYKYLFTQNFVSILTLHWFVVFVFSHTVLFH